MDKIDLIEFLANDLDDRQVEGLGFVLATADGADDDSLIIESWPDGDDKPCTAFRLRVTRLRH